MISEQTSLKCLPDEDWKVIELPFQCHGQQLFFVCGDDRVVCIREDAGSWFMNVTSRKFILILQEFYDV